VDRFLADSDPVDDFLVLLIAKCFISTDTGLTQDKGRAPTPGELAPYLHRESGQGSAGSVRQGWRE
jgi:hypothetical protein